MKLNCSVNGYWNQIDIIREDGSIRKTIPVFKNLVLDQGLNMIGTVSDWFNTLYLGKGTTAPTTADTAMEDPVVISATLENDVKGMLDSNSPGVFRERTWLTDQFSEDVNLAEIGVGNATTLFSRSLIRNAQDQPIVMDILAGERVRATYRSTLSINTSEVISTFSLSVLGVPTTTTFTSLPAFVTDSSKWDWPVASDRAVYVKLGNGPVGPVTGGISGGGSNLPGTKISVEDYVPGSFKRSFKITLSADDNPPLDPNDAYTLQSIEFQLGYGTFQMMFSPVMIKDSGRSLVLNCEYGWTRQI